MGGLSKEFDADWMTVVVGQYGGEMFHPISNSSISLQHGCTRCSISDHDSKHNWIIADISGTKEVVLAMCVHGCPDTGGEWPSSLQHVKTTWSIAGKSVENVQVGCCSRKPQKCDACKKR